MVGSFVSFYQMFRECFTLAVLASFLNFIFQNSDGDRKSVELMVGAINKFLVTSSLLLQGLNSSCENTSPFLRKSCLLFPSLDDL